MAKGKVKTHGGDSAAPAPARSLRSRKREGPSDELSDTVVQVNICHQNTEGTNSAVDSTLMQPPLQEPTKHHQAAEQPCPTNQEPVTEENPTNVTDVMVTNFAEQEETTIPYPSNNSEHKGFTVQTETAVQKNEEERAELTTEECSRSPIKTGNDQPQVFVPSFEEGGGSDSASLEKQEGASQNSNRSPEKNKETSREAYLNAGTPDVTVIAKEAASGLPAKKKRRMGMCGLTERERSHFLQTQKRESGQKEPERAEARTEENAADQVIQEEVLPAHASPPSDSIPVDSVPMDTAPMSSAPADGAPVDSLPMDTAPVSSAAADGAPVDSVPMDTAPMSSAPSDGTPVDSVPMDTAPMSSAAADGALVQNVPMDTAPVSSAAVDSELVGRVSEENEAAIELQSEECRADKRAGAELYITVSYSDGDRTLSDPDYTQEGNRAAAGEPDPDPKLGPSPKREEREKERMSGGKEESETISTGSTKFKEMEDMDEPETTSQVVNDATMTTDKLTGNGGNLPGATTDPSITEIQPEASSCVSAELCETAATPGGSEENCSLDPAKELYVSPPAVNPEPPLGRTPSDPFGPGCLDYVSDSQLNTISLIEEALTERGDALTLSGGHEDASDLLCGLIRELSSLNRKVMAAHRELENLRRNSKSSRSSAR